MNRLYAFFFSVVLAFCFSLFAEAEEVTLYATQYPEGVRVDIPFQTTFRIQGAILEGEGTFEEGQGMVRLSFRKMKPAILFGGDISAYVVWAVTRDGEVENLGELKVVKEKGKGEFSTGKKAFALMVTAEPHPGVTRPSSLVLFTSLPTHQKRATSTSFVFKTFASPPEHALEDISSVAYEGEKPIELIQARRTFNFAKKGGAETYAPAILRDAKIKLAQAEGLSKARKNREGMMDYARRSIALSAEAIRTTEKKKEAQRLEKEIAERKAFIAQLKKQVEEAQKARKAVMAQAEQLQGKVEALQKLIHESQSQQEGLMARTAQLQAQLKQLEDQKTTLTQGMEALKKEKMHLEEAKKELEGVLVKLRKERDDLSERLEKALQQVAETRSSARGLIINLPDILFDVNQATLKESAKITLAKVAGILLIMKDLSLTIEGHTDSQGSPEYNMTLSQKRAEAVLNFLRTQGVDPHRMTAKGYGMTRPIADNATPEGRAKNRRVEIIIAKAPGSSSP